MSQYLMSEEGVGSGEGGERTSFARQYASKNRLPSLEQFEKKWLNNASARAAAADIRSDEEQRMVKEVQKRKVVQGLQEEEVVEDSGETGGGGSMSFGRGAGSPESAALTAGITTGLATMNPVTGLFAAAIGYFDAKEKEKAMEEERARIEANNREIRKMQARSDFMQGMRAVYKTQAERRLNL